MEDVRSKDLRGWVATCLQFHTIKTWVLLQ